MILSASLVDGEGAAAAAARAKGEEAEGVPTAVAVQQPPVAECMQEAYHEATPEVSKFYQVAS
jgi:hypothetical protein